MKYALVGSATIDQEDVILSDMSVEVRNANDKLVATMHVDDLQIEHGFDFKISWKQEDPLPHKVGLE
jgi:hypothetical protein